MDCGMPTLFEAPSISECAELCADSGLKFIELNMNFPGYQAESLNTEEALRIARRYGIYYTFHLDETCNPCDFNNLVAQAYVHTVLKTIENAKRLSAPLITMHAADGIYLSLPNEKIWLYRHYARHYEKKLVEFRNVCEQAIGNSDLKICIENTNGYKDFQKTGIDLLLESPVFGLTFDIGHNHSAGNIDEPFIRERKSRLYHFHFHDADGPKSHLVPGTGKIPLCEYAELAKDTNSRMVLEIKTIEGLQQSVLWIARSLQSARADSSCKVI